MSSQPPEVDLRREIDVAELRHSLRSAAHDLRSSLGPLVGYSELLLLACEDEERAEAYAAKIGESAERLQDFADCLVERIMGSIGLGRDVEPPESG